MRIFLNKIAQKALAARAILLHPELRQAYRITSHLTSQERLRLFELARGKKNLLEIGSYLGASAACFGAAIHRDNGARIFCIDTWNNDAMTEGQKDTYQSFSENTISFSKVILPIRGFSTAVVHTIKERTNELDLLFIDGDHSYEGAKADWMSYKNFLTPGSIVIFHDIGWATGVQKVVEEIKPLFKTHDQLPNLWWGEIGTKP